MISVLQEEVDNKILNLQNIWNIFDIESNTGIIKYTDGYSQAIIFLDRGSVIGKSKDFETIHKNSVANIIRYFISNGYEVRFDSKINRKADDSAILYLEKFANKLKSKGLNLRNRIQISYMKKFSRRVSYTEEDYIIVRTNKRELLPNMYEDIKGIESEVQNSSYVDYKVLNKTEALEFIAEDLGIDHIDFNHILDLIYNKKINNIGILDNTELGGLIDISQLEEHILGDD